VIQRREELCNIKSHHTSLEALGPASTYQVSEKETSILCRSLSNTSKLVGVKNAILDGIKLKSPSNHLLNELVKCVEKDNRPEGLWGVVGQFAWLRDDNRD